MIDQGARSVAPRLLAWRSGAGLLVALGLVTLGLAATAGGGVLVALLAIPPLVAGTACFRRWPWSRGTAFGVAINYAVAVGYVATTPWRGLTPPSGQPAPALDPRTVLVALAFLAAAVLVVLGPPADAPGRPTER